MVGDRGNKLTDEQKSIYREAMSLAPFLGLGDDLSAAYLILIRNLSQIRHICWRHCHIAHTRITFI